MLIFVAYQKTYGATGGCALKHARKDFDFVALLAVGGEFALTGLAAVEFVLQKVHVNLYAGWHAVDDAAYAGPVALAKGCEAEYLAKSVHVVGGERVSGLMG